MTTLNRGGDSNPDDFIAVLKVHYVCFQTFLVTDLIDSKNDIYDECAEIDEDWAGAFLDRYDLSEADSHWENMGEVKTELIERMRKFPKVNEFYE